MYAGLIFLMLSLIIFIHELGHFLIAKTLKIQPKAFAIGFGKALWKREKGGVLYSFNAFPLGGYVNFDMVKFQDEPHYKRLLVLSGGILFSLIFAFISIFIFVLIVRLPLIYTEYQAMPALEWGVGTFLLYSWQSFINTGGLVIVGLGALFSSPDMTNIMGPVRIVTEGASLLGENLLFFIPLLILININIMIVNALPFPALDGGRIVFTIIEWITKRKIPYAEKIHFGGLVVLLLFVATILINDIYMVLS